MRIGKCFLAIIVLVLDLLSQDVMVNNINFIINDQQVEIRYDLDGDQESKYKVDLVMKKKSSPDFCKVPRTISGDVGKGKWSGNNRIIFWDFVKEFQFEGDIDDYYFEVTARKIWLTPKVYLCAGAAIIVGTVTVLLLTGEEEGAAIKLPPSRPY
jgi:hypothetical protein